MENDEHDRDDGAGTPAERQPIFWLEQAPQGETAPPGRSEWSDDAQGPDWGRLADGLWRWKWLVLAVTLVGVGAGVFLMERAEPVYETEATIWLGPSEEEEGPIRPADIFEGQGWADLLGSQAVLKPVAEERRLFVRAIAGVDSSDLRTLEITDDLQSGRYRLTVTGRDRFELVGKGGDVIQRGRLGRDTVGVPAGFRWTPPEGLSGDDAAATFHLSTPSQAARRLSDHLQIMFDPEAGNLITSTFRWDDPEGTARLHNAILTSFTRVAERLKTQKLREVEDILERQTGYAAARLDSAELALENFRVNTITLPRERQSSSYVPPASGEGTAAGRTSDPSAEGRDPVFSAFFRAKLRRDELQSQVQDLQSVLQRVRERGELDALALRMNPAVEESDRLQSALDELTQKESERRTLLYQYTEEYPQVQEVTGRIETLKQQMIPGLVQDLIDQLQSRIGELDDRIESQADELRSIPTRTIREAQLRREVELAEQLHSDLLNRLKEAELAASTNLPDLQVVDRASPPGAPSENPGPRLLMIASMAGLGLGLGGTLLLLRLDDRVRYPDQITEGMGLPVLGLVPRIPTRGTATDQRRNETVESFRAIRSQLTREAGSRDSVFLVTSPSPREGKTFVTTNLGISFAAAGRRTLLVDADTRRGDLETFFERPAAPGLTDYLRREKELGDIEVATEFERLFLVPHGDSAAFDPELLDGPRMDEFLRDVRGRYDVVLLDAPPFMAGADTLVLGERTDQVVVVVRTGETKTDAARARLDGIGNFDLPLAGAVLNDVPAKGRYYQYYYYSYHSPQIEGRVLAD